jgi:biopolymer transport protein ExbD
MEVEDLESIKRKYNEQNVQVKFNQVGIPIIFGGLTLSQLVQRMEYLEARVKQLEFEHASEKVKINDTAAQRIIIDYIREKKSEKIKQLNTFDISTDLRLPVDQVSKIMNLLKAKGAKEID